ncbi:hypothetical protein P26059A_0098 [Curvibacter phage P26059A]|nr:hypothetical protein P26059A_0098 [Curvibacter phage P26059A]
MTLSLNKNAGKGDRRRATQNDEAYRSNYDSIFGKKIKGEHHVVTEGETTPDATDKEQDKT